MSETKLIYFSSPTCMPCKIFKPTLERVSKELSVPVDYVDIFDSPELASLWGVMSTPTTILVDSSESEVKRAVGAMSRPGLTEFINA